MVSTATDTFEINRMSTDISEISVTSTNVYEVTVMSSESLITETTSSNDIPTGDEAHNILGLATFIVYITFGTLGILGNGLVLYVIARVKELHDTTNLFIVNQSLIDGLSSIFLIGNFVLPKPLLPKGNPLLARFICGVWYSQFLYWVTYVATLVNLMILTLERFCAVLYPIRYRKYKNGKVLAVLVLVPWLIGALQQFYLILISRVEGQSCLLFQWPNAILQPAMGICIFVVYFLLTFSCMSYMYIRILVKLKEVPNTGLGSVHQAKDIRGLARRNAVKTMMTLSVCYSTCLAPGSFTYLAYCFGADVDLQGTFYHVTVCIAFICVWINPFVYTFQYHKFQKGLKTVFGCTRRAPDRQVQFVHTVAASTPSY